MTRQTSLSRNGRTSPDYRWLAAILGIALIVAMPAAASEDQAKANKEAEAADALPLPPTTPMRLSPAEQYCSSVVDAAAAAQIAKQTSNLQKAEKQLDDRVALLAAKTEELKGWVKKREDFTAHATEMLVKIYSKMKPDAAASQLVAMDEMTAAAITSKLAPKVSSLVLAEMDATKAARLMAVIAGAGGIAMKQESQADAQQR